MNNRELIIQNKVLKEQNEKLIGSIRTLNATSEHLIVKMKEIEDSQKKSEDAFDNIFFYNMNAQWDKVPEERKKAMTIVDKAIWFNQTLRDLKFGLRQLFTKQLNKYKDKADNLEEKVTELQKKNSAMEDYLQGIFISEGHDKGLTGEKLTNYVVKRINEVCGMEKPRGNTKENKSVENSDPFSSIKPKTATKKPTKTKSDDEKKDSKYLQENIKEINIKSLYEQNEKFRLVAANIASKISDKGKNIVRYVGETGEYNRSKIQRELGLKDYTEFERLEKIKVAQINEANKVKVSSSVTTPFTLTTIGYVYYYYLTDKNPISRINVKAQKSVQHSVFIDTVLNFLKEKGCKCTTEESLSTGDGGASICDIKAELNGETFRIEVEVGEGSTEHYAEKILKIAETSGDVIFITENETRIIRALTEVNKKQEYINNVKREWVGSMTKFKKTFPNFEKIEKPTPFF